jgi:transposase
MRSSIKSDNSVAVSEINTANLSADSQESTADPQVKPKKPYAPRRHYNLAHKQQILAAYGACKNASERGALLRREGLYYARVARWRRERALEREGNQDHRGGKNKVRVDHLTREVEQLKKKLAQAQAIIDLQKKVSELLGAHILPHESSEVIL